MTDPFALPIHGGDLGAAEARFGRPAAGWLDLSTGVNPFAYPLPPLDPALWEKLPDRALELALRGVAADAYGAASAEQLATAPGSQALIQLLPRLRPFSTVAVVGPTYGEHAACWSNAGHQVQPCEALENAAAADVVVVGNPNNPDGRCHDSRQLLDLADSLAERGGLLVVDEAFADCQPELSLAGQVRPGLLVLRSFGKFFGLAGLRLGFAIGDPTLIRLLRSAIGPWAVGGPALAIGRLALADTAWIAETRRRLDAEAAALDRLLTGFGLSVIGGTPLFRLVNASRAWALYEHLGQRGILVRPFAVAPRWLRFGLPPEDILARQRLRDALAAWQ
ncbi:MAG TPA: threonine-phosphate decarboxylase [Rhodospirillaceae bacterium]|nr:threonine-phosphate decarboxylase [Rhodospirillaceae bacterium]